MTTAIDSNVLIDLIGTRTAFSEGSIACLDRARLAGALFICPVVAAEISGHFSSPSHLQTVLKAMQISVSDFSLEDAHAAGTAFIRYKRRSSKPKERMLADFLIAAHALHQADTLLTRDRGYYQTYFPKLKLMTP
jgi:predicted nucleic acid-binding protein